MVMVLAICGSQSLEVDTSSERVLDKRGKKWRQYRESIELFGSDELVVIGLQAEQPFALRTMQKVATIGERLISISGVRRVDSVANVPLIALGDGGEMIVGTILSGSEHGNADVIEDMVTKNPIARDNLVSRDGKVFAINLTLDDTQGRGFGEILDSIRLEVPEDAWITGVPIFRTEIHRMTGSEVVAFSGATICLLACVLLVFLRSMVVVMHSLLMGVIGSVVVLGVMGWLGIPLGLSTMILPPITLALGCVYALHLFWSEAQDSRRDRDRDQGEVGQQVLLSGVTTAIGFLGVGASRIAALQEVGALGAVGALCSAGACLSLLPALRVLERHSGIEQLVARVFLINRLIPRVLQIVTGRRVLILVTTASVLAFLSAGWNRIMFETDATKWFVQGTQVRDAYENIRRRLSGISPVNFVIQSTGERRVTEPAILREIQRLSAYVGSRKDVGKIISIVDVIRDVDRVFGKKESGEIPESEEAVEQFLLLSGGNERLGDFLSSDRRSTNLQVRVDDNGSGALLRIAREGEEFWSELGVEGMSLYATGIMYEFARAEEEISKSQVYGLAGAIGLIGCFLMFALGAPWIVLCALLTNATPIASGYGVMGIMNIPLDAGTVLIGSLALGIAIDDSIHIASGFLLAETRGVTAASRLEFALNRSFGPVLVSSVALGLGFLIFGFSSFAVTRNLGFLMSGVLFMCLVSNTFLLPVLLTIGSKGERQSRGQWQSLGEG